MNFTEEQQHVINFSIEKSEDLVVNAYAGTGKTSTLIGIVKAVPDTKFLYLVFNKAIKLEAEKKFPKNCTVSTMHSLAYRYFAKDHYGKVLQARLSMRWRNKDYKEYFDVENQFKSSSFLSFAAKTAVNRFKNSNHKTLNEFNIDPEHKEDLRPREIAYVVNLAQKIWDLENNPNADTPITHDTYLKGYELSNPSMPDFDTLLLDEAQDTNPVTASIVKSFKKHTILVGDSFQAIYKWRGAVNTLKNYELSGVTTLWLTKSFRFGQPIAELATKILRTLDPKTPIVVGNQDIDSKLEKIDKNSQYTELFRTNAELASEALSLIADDKAVYIEGGVTELCNNLRDLYLLSKNRRKTGKSDKYRPFFDYFEVMEEAEHSLEVQRDVKFIETHGDDVPELLDILSSSIKDRRGMNSADVILSTAHKAKGLEWNQVILAEDFRYSSKSEDEWNLIYVAATRAILTLEAPLGAINRGLEDFGTPKQESGMAEKAKALLQGLASCLREEQEGLKN